jgi:ATP-binding cassette subfamily B protein/subfamily B ATP-binding cassette protein MsbA
MAVSTVWLGKRIRRSSTAVRQVEGEIQAHLHQTLTGIAVVQAFAQEDREDERFDEFVDRAIRARRKGVLFSSLTDLGTGAVSTLGTAVVLFIGAHRVLDGSLTVGALLVFVAYLNNLQSQMAAMMNAYRVWQGSGGQVDRVLDVLESPPEVRDAPSAARLPTVKGDVRLEGVCFGYEPGRPILREVNLRAAPGQTLAIVGPTGAGKSTLVGLIPRFADPWQGRVSIDGYNVREVALIDLRRQVSLVMQEPFLFPISVAQNIAFGRPDAPREQILAAARAANAHEFISRLPSGYDTVIGERGATLSGGERQRLSIARALLKDAPVLILDEPTSALDAETEAQLLEALDRLMEGRTTFIIAHRLSTIRNADTIVLLDGGRVRECGSHEELMQLGGAYAEMNRIHSAAPAQSAPATAAQAVAVVGAVAG